MSRDTLLLPDGSTTGTHIEVSRTAAPAAGYAAKQALDVWVRGAETTAATTALPAALASAGAGAAAATSTTPLNVAASVAALSELVVMSTSAGNYLGYAVGVTSATGLQLFLNDRVAFVVKPGAVVAIVRASGAGTIRYWITPLA